MSIKADSWIKKMVKKQSIIDPFIDHSVKEGMVSFGLSPYGYDLRIAPEYKIFTNVHSAIVDPKKFDAKSFVDVKDVDSVLIPPNSFALGRSVEYLRIPNNCLALCIGKSTYARCGIIVNVTPVQPGWEGHLVIEISNTTPLPAKVYSGEGIALLIFFESDKKSEMAYISKYLNQKNSIVLPKV